MKTSASENLFRVTGPLRGEFTGQRRIPLTKASDIFLDLGPNKRLSKQSRRRWYEAPLRSLWRRCNAMFRSRFKLKTVLQGIEIQMTKIRRSLHNMRPSYLYDAKYLNLWQDIFVLLLNGVYCYCAVLKFTSY